MLYVALSRVGSPDLFTLLVKGIHATRYLVRIYIPLFSAQEYTNTLKVLKFLVYDLHEGQKLFQSFIVTISLCNLRLVFPSLC